MGRAAVGTGDPGPVNGNIGAVILKSGQALHQNQIKYQTSEETVIGNLLQGERFGLAPVCSHWGPHICAAPKGSHRGGGGRGFRGAI